MGGKKMINQRTKGNVRPSNSGRSAELLTNSGTVNFIGFNSLKSQHLTQENEDKMDGMMSMVMKKMQKRDTVTKLKAVQEFRDLCKEKDKDCLISILPFWPRLYNRLALDTDRRIREVTQEANGKLIEKVKREIAPYLRNVMGVWLISQCDLYAPASSAASNAFTVTFPEAKKKEALMFCRGEVFQFIKDCLFEQTAESLSEPNSTSEEIENKYVLVVTGCLRGLKLFLNVICSEERKDVLEDIKTMILTKKFWKFSKHKIPQIRVAWYELVSVIAHIIPEAFEHLEQKLGTAILGCLSEQDPSVAPAVWEAALHFVAGFENCWNNVDVHKVVLPELWTLLRGGGTGNASLLFPCLLPFLSRLPIKSIKHPQKFFADFLSSIRTSLFLDAIKRSNVECNAVVTAFMECLLYVCVHVDLSVEDEAVVINDSICNQLYPLVESSFSTEGLHLPVSKFYPLLGKCLWNLEVYTSQQNDNKSNAIKKSLHCFWKQMSSLCSTILKNDHLQQHHDLVFLAYLFHCLYDPQNFLDKKIAVTFSDGELQCNNKSFITSCNALSDASALQAELQEELLACTLQVSKILCQKLKDSISVHYIKLLTEILGASRCSKVFLEILKELSEVTDCNEEESSLLFFQHVVSVWVQKSARNTVLLEHLMDITLVICSCSDALKVLELCSKAEVPDFLNIMLARVLKLPEEDEVFVKFLKSPCFSYIFAKLIKFVSNHLVISSTANEKVDWNSYFHVLHSSLAVISRLGLGLTTKDVEKIFLTLKSEVEKMLQDVRKCCLDFDVLDFICDLVEKIFDYYPSCWSLSVSEDLVTVFFNLSFLTGTLSSKEELLKKIQSMWQIYLRKSLTLKTWVKRNGRFISNASERIHSLIINPDSSDMQHAVIENTSTFLNELLSELCECVFSGECEKYNSFLADVMMTVLPSDTEWEKLRTGSALDLIPSFLEKRLFFPLECCKVVFQECESVQMYLRVAQTVAEIFIECLNISSEICVSGEQKVVETILKELLEKYILHHLHQLLWAFSYCESYGYLKSEGTEECNTALSLQKSCSKLIRFLPKTSACQFLNQLVKMEDPIQWCLPLHYGTEIVRAIYPNDWFLDLSSCERLVEMKSEEQCLFDQIIISHLPVDQKVVIAKLLFCEASNIEKITCKKYLGVLSKLCCCFQEKELFNNSFLSSNLAFIFTQLFSSVLLVKEIDENFYLMSSQLSFLLHETIKNDPSIVYPLMTDVLQFLSFLFELLIQKKDAILSDVDLLIYSHHCCSLLHAVMVHLFDAKLPTEREKFSSMQSSFNKAIAKNILIIFLGMTEICSSKFVQRKGMEAFLTSLVHSVELISDEHFRDAFFCEGSKNYEQEVNNALERLMQPLMSGIRPLQLGAHLVVIRLMHQFSLCVGNEEEEKDGDEKKERLTPLVGTIKYTSEIVENMLLDFHIYDCCIILPETDSFTYTSSYLFAWNELFEFYSSSTPQERSACAMCLENNNLLSSLLSNLFRLIPENPVLCHKSKERESKGSEILKSIFCKQPVLSLSDQACAEDLQHLACSTYYTALAKFPAIVRTWWNNLDKRSADAVNSFTSKYVSSLISTQEIKDVGKCRGQCDNMKVQACLGSREVVATYTVDGSSIELVIQLPTNYPLGPCSIEKRGNVKLGQQQWRHWLMQLTSFLTYQNGSILDGLILWKKNLDKKFDGIEECPICYFILHVSTAKLPNRSCSTCKKKFHADCMRKWFVTSNNSTCPLCRNLW